ncbi:hypothetical protein GDO81_005976 [Engystomops pustulosus]|uniref:Uncharacterized protein n=1 Tax=Engystomops pustulosus TaxID=76066 RepID=A0AAV7CTJ0_ENGPU|nr:hypothetical protein GDO81_005976 [Engystomops pustulosus]
MSDLHRNRTRIWVYTILNSYHSLHFETNAFDTTNTLYRFATAVHGVHIVSNARLSAWISCNPPLSGYIHSSKGYIVNYTYYSLKYYCTLHIYVNSAFSCHKSHNTFLTKIDPFI